MDEFVESKNILVTGGAGYLGSHICKQLSVQGWTPVCYDNLYRGHKKLVQWGPFVHGDILDTPLLQSTLAEFRVQAVIHTAALAYVNESNDNPSDYFLNNVQGTESLVQALVKTHVKKVIFSSSCAVYGIAQSNTLNENHPQNPISRYGESKKQAEHVFSQSKDSVQSIILRCFNVAGADLDLQIGECHQPETHLIPRAIEAASTQKPFVIFTNSDSTSQSPFVRDFVHVQDVAQAHVIALTHLMSHKIKNSFSIFNIGSGKGYSTNEILNKIEELTHKKINRFTVQAPPGNPPHLIADISHAQKKLKWSPVKSDLDTILNTAIAWYKKNSSQN